MAQRGDPAVDLYICPICGKTFSKSSSLTQRIVRAHGSYKLIVDAGKFITRLEKLERNEILSRFYPGAGYTVQVFARIARERGMTAAGCFALEDGQALNMYKKAGYAPAILQTEWYKCLK